MALVAAVGCSGAAWAQSTDWQNPAAGDWFTGANWSAGVPNSATLNTSIINGGTAQIVAGTADAGSATAGATLTIGNGSTLDLQAGGGLNFETMVIQANGTFRAANDNWGGGCSNPCITLAGGTLLRVGGAGVYWDGFTLLANTTSTVMAGAGSSLALEPGRSGQHFGIASFYTFQPGSVLQIGGLVTYSGGANVTSGGNTGLVVLTGGTLQANNPQVVNAPLVGLGLHELTSVVTTTTVQTGALLNFNGLSGTINNLQGAGTVGTGAVAGVVISLGQGNFSGSITGLGGITQLSGGVTTLSGTSSYTGPTIINAGGTLIVDGSIATSSSTTVDGTLAGGTLTTPGFVGNAIINGTLSPGTGASGLGLLNTGTLQFNAGSTYVVNVTATGLNDRVNASGAAMINGGIVVAQAAPGNYGQSTTYTILSAAGGRTGTFSGVTSNFAFLTPSLSYTTTDVLLTLTRTATFSSAALTPNQRSVANALETLATGNPLFLALVGLTADDARRAFDLLSGEIYASVQGVILQDSQYVRQLILGRLRQGMFAAQSGPFAALQNGPAVASSVYAPDVRSGLGMTSARRPYGASPIHAPPSPWSMWAQAVGSRGEIDDDGNAARVDRTLSGVFGGVDGRISQAWRVGVAGGYTQSDVDVEARLSSAEIDTAHVAAYAGARWGLVNLRLGSALSWHDIDTRRTIVFPGFSDATRASYDARTGQAFGELGLGMALGNLALEPFAGLAWVRVGTDRFAETGGAAALVGSGTSMDTAFSTLGIRVGMSHALANGMAFVPRAAVAWQHAFGDVDPLAALAFQSGSSPFIIAGAPLSRDSALVEAGFDLALAPQTRLGIAYEGSLSDRVTDHSVKASASWKF